MRRKTCSSRALVGVQGRRGSASRLPGQPPNLRRQVGPVARREEQTRLAYSQLYCSPLYYSQLSVNSSPVSPSATRLDSPPAHSLRVCAARFSFFFFCHGRHQNRQPAMRRRLISAHLGAPRLISANLGSISADLSPPASAATAGTPEAIASSTTKPSVSESEGITCAQPAGRLTAIVSRGCRPATRRALTKTSAAAYARERSSPCRTPSKNEIADGRVFLFYERSSPPQNAGKHHRRTGKLAAQTRLRADQSEGGVDRW